MKNLGKFISTQLSLWPLACENFRALKNVLVRQSEVGGLGVILQHNPARIVSSAASLDKETLAHRKCFLCSANRPAEQISRDFEGRKGRKYDILLNPYPILRDHLVIAMKQHCDQSIWRRYVDMLDLARAYQNFIVFYNGPRCGASAPDHHHFQAAARGQLPLENDVDRLLGMVSAGTVPDGLKYLSSSLDADVFLYEKFVSGIFVIRGSTSKSVAKMFYRLLDCAPWDTEAHPEPMCNVFTWYSSGEFRSIVIFRAAHRSHHYYSGGPDHLTMSPGCTDMAGCIVVPVAEEFDRIDEAMLDSLLREVALKKEDEALICRRLVRTQQNVSVGIMSGKEIAFEILTDGAGVRRAVWKEGKIEYDGSLYDELFFEARTLSTMFAEPTFRLCGVTIGVGFHWERKEDQSFAGALRIIVDRDRLTAVNVIGIEDYLVSVISSEMKSTAPEEFLKAHAVISRSWLVNQIRHRADGSGRKKLPPEINDVPALVSYLDTELNVPADSVPEKIVRWYDREDHSKFDVCADDHCQRYQGLTRAAGRAAMKAVDATWGEVLMYDGEICDARFSKCCGGVMEKFSSCWDDVDYDYLQGIADTENSGPADLSDEKTFRSWLSGPSGEYFCGRVSSGLLSQVLNSYDRETGDFFRWQAVYGREELSSLFAAKSGTDVGEIQALVPVRRGTSGRIVQLEVIGSRRTVTVGKELEIRRCLSESHLKSSAFTVDYLDSCGGMLDAGEVEDLARKGERAGFSVIRLRGAGWGHGVGLCQIGAAVMAAEGHTYREILSHYYPGASPAQGGPRILLCSL